MLHARGSPKDREHTGALIAAALDTALAHSFGGIERRVRALDVLGQDVDDWLTGRKTPGAVEIAVFTARRSSWVTVTLV